MQNTRWNKIRELADCHSFELALVVGPQPAQQAQREATAYMKATTVAAQLALRWGLPH